MVSGISANYNRMAQYTINSAASASIDKGVSIIQNAMNHSGKIPLMASVTAPIVDNTVQNTGILKKVCEFLFGNWGPALGSKLKTFMKDGGKFKDFKWINSYKEITSVAAKESAKKSAEAAGKGIFKKCLGFAGKMLGPLLFLGPAVLSAINELRQGTTGGAVKELAKGTICMLGYTLGGIVAAALLGSGGWMVAVGTFIVSTGVGMGIDTLTKKVLGPSTAEVNVELAKQQNSGQSNPFAQQQNPFAQNAFAQAANKNRSLASFGTNINPSAEMAHINEIAKRAKEIFDSRNNIAMI